MRAVVAHEFGHPSVTPELVATPRTADSFTASLIPAMRVLVLSAFALRLLGAGAPIDPRGPPALPGSRQKAVLRRQVSDEPSGALTKMAIFAMGRFWCAEPVFARLHGVISTEVGYTGGWTTDPTYKEVHDPPEGQPSGHAFAVRIGYDPGHITLKMLLEVFFDAHGEWPLTAGTYVSCLPVRPSAALHARQMPPRSTVRVVTSDPNSVPRSFTTRATLRTRIPAWRRCGRRDPTTAGTS